MDEVFAIIENCVTIVYMLGKLALYIVLMWLLVKLLKELLKKIKKEEKENDE